MNRKLLTLVVATLLLIGAAGLLLAGRGAYLKLGAPGVRLSQTPAFGPDGRIASTNSVYLPERVLDYTSEPVLISEAEMISLPKDTTYGRRVYTSIQGGRTNQLLLQVVLMGTDRTSIHRPEFCLTGQGWNIARTEAARIAVGGPQPFGLPVTRMTGLGQFQLPDGNKASLSATYVFWFVADDRVTAGLGDRMWIMAKRLLTEGVLTRWAYVGCWASTPPGQEETAFGDIQRFLAAAVPEFQVTRPRGAVAPAPGP